MSDSLTALGVGVPTTASKGRNQFMADINAREPLKGKTVLIVDYASATRRALQDQLVQLGASTIRYAASTADTFRALESNHVELVLCEHQLDDQRTGQQLLEELREAGKLNWDASFVMITGERKFGNVLGVLEFEPDDYLIKPFTSQQLSERIIKIFAKKNALSPLLKATGEKNYAAVVEKSDAILKKHPQFSTDIFRLKANALMALKDYEVAEKLLVEGIAEKAAPWMRMSLARIYMAKGNLAQAEIELKIVVTEKPHFISARDLLSDVLWELNRPTEALETLEDVGTAGLQNVQRLRKLADLAMRVNDTTKTKTYLQKAIDRTHGTSLAKADDYVNLSTALVAEGRLEDAEKVAQKMRSTSQTPDMEVAKLLMRLKRDAYDGNADQALETLNKAIEIFNTASPTPSPMIQISLVEACFELSQRDAGFKMARSLATRGSTKAVLDRLRIAMDSAKTRRPEQVGVQ